MNMFLLVLINLGHYIHKPSLTLETHEDVLYMLLCFPTREQSMLAMSRGTRKFSHSSHHIHPT